MKSILALIATTAAVKINDAPPHFNEPTWRQTWPSASGLVQTQTMSACEKFGTVGVTCGPSDEKLFAAGLNGDENLSGEVKIFKQPFVYSQNSPGVSFAQLNQAPFPQYEAQSPEKVLVPQTTHARYHSTYF